MTDFAKLFVADGIGQILITTSINDEGNPCLICRIPDTADAILETSIQYRGSDVTKGEKIMSDLLREMTLESAIKMADPLVQSRNTLE
jgi:hypothetical protein